MNESMALVERWMSELSGAVAWLEAFGYVHVDLAPQSLLLDKDNHLEVVDFEDLAEIGRKSNGNQCPCSGTRCSKPNRIVWAVRCPNGAVICFLVHRLSYDTRL